VLSFKEIDAEI